jgi:hypothetical protein
MDGVARALHHALPAQFGELSFSVDDEHQIEVQGASSEAFMVAWRSDIALDAAAGMLVSRLAEPNRAEADLLDPTAMSALTRRVGKLLRRMAPSEL